MKIHSKNDPILDCREVCAQLGPQSQEALHAELLKLGWHEDVATKAITLATGSYIHKQTDGMFATGEAV